MTEAVHPAQLLFTEKHPLTSELDMRFTPALDQTLTVMVSAPAGFADQDGVHVHTGFNALLLDTVLGSCAIGELQKPQPIATIKLATNHIGRAVVGEDIICQAVYEGEENEIAYVSGKILAGPEKRLVAQAIGTFMIGTTTKSIREKT